MCIYSQSFCVQLDHLPEAQNNPQDVHDNVVSVVLEALSVEPAA